MTATALANSRFSGAPDSAQYDVIYEARVTAADEAAAIQAAISDPQMPVLGAALTQITSYTLTVQGYAVERLAPNCATPGDWIVMMIVQYRTPRFQSVPPSSTGPGLTIVGASVEAVRTEVNSAGDALLVENSQNVAQVAPADVFVPRTERRFNRTEPTNPQAKADQFVGTVNSTLWNGHAPRTQLCKAIIGRSRDNGATWEVEHVFDRKSATWDLTLVGTDLVTGERIANPVGPQIATEEFYPTEDFNLLSISL